MKTIEVVAAIIKQDNEIFTTRRGNGEFVNKPDKNANFLLINL